MERRSSMRLRHRSNDVIYVNGECDSDSEGLPSPPKKKAIPPTIKTIIVREYDVLKSRILLKEPELMLECDDDPLTIIQLRSNHLAKEAHALSMKQIQAAHENRLSFDGEGKPVIHDVPINVQKATVNPFTNNGGLTISHPVKVLQPNIPISKIQTMYRPILSNTQTLLKPPMQLANGGRYVVGINSPIASIPVQRVAAQPRKEPRPLETRIVSGRIVWATPKTDVISGTSGLGIKRTFGEMVLAPEPRRETDKNIHQRMTEIRKLNEVDWETIDEYYYGKKEGISNYVDEKEEFRFKCWYCNKMLYNNVKAMTHLQSHIDSEKQQNLDLRDLTQCKHCYKQFDTPFDMQTHIEKVHLTNSNILMCRICEKDHETKNSLMTHMKNTHTKCEMPYICQICEFRSSMYGDVVDHFKKKHDSSQNLLCLYCLRVFKIKFIGNGWGSTQNFYHHLVKHQSKSRSKKCHSCKLTFLNPQEAKNHQKKDHLANRKGLDTSAVALPGNRAAQQSESSSRSVKSLNAPAVMKNVDLSRIHMPSFSKDYYCYECKQSLSNHDHFKNHNECSMCRYATSCSTAYANHMLSFHSGKSAFLTITEEHLLPTRLFCLCGFSSRYGNKIANHMVFCFKRTCYSQKTDSEFPKENESPVNPAPRTGSSILDVLGLMKKQTAKRSSDEGQSTSQYESETFVGITTLGMAHRDAAANDASLESDGDSDDDFVLGEEEVESDNDDVDDDDDDYKPGGRFRKPPNSGSGSGSRSGSNRRSLQNPGAMLVKMNFARNKSKKESSVNKNFGITQPLHMSRESTPSENQPPSSLPNMEEGALTRDTSIKSENISIRNSADEKLETEKLDASSEKSGKSVTNLDVAKDSAANENSNGSDSKTDFSSKTSSSANKKDDDKSENTAIEALEDSQNYETKSESVKNVEKTDIFAKGEQSTASKNIEKSAEVNKDLEPEILNEGETATKAEENSEKSKVVEVSGKISKDTNDIKDKEDSSEISNTAETMDTSETTSVSRDTSDTIETSDQQTKGKSDGSNEAKAEEPCENIKTVMADTAENVSGKTENTENLEKAKKDMNTEEEMESSAFVSQEEINPPKDLISKPEDGIQKPEAHIPKPEDTLPKPEDTLPKPEDTLPKPEDTLPKPEDKSYQVDKLNADEIHSKSESLKEDQNSSSVISSETEKHLPKSAEISEESYSKNADFDINEIKDHANVEHKNLSSDLKRDDVQNVDLGQTSELGEKSNTAKTFESEENPEAALQKGSETEANLMPSLTREESFESNSKSSKFTDHASKSEPSPNQSKDRQSSDSSPSKEYRSDERRSDGRDRKSSESRDSRSHDDRRDSSHSRSCAHDKSDRRHSGSGHSRSQDYDRHSNRYDRDDKYRDRSSGRKDDRGGRGYDRYDDRGYSDRHDDRGHSSRDRDQHKDSRNSDRNRKDRDSQGSHSNRHGRDGYHSSHRRDY